MWLKPGDECPHPSKGLIYAERWAQGTMTTLCGKIINLLKQWSLTGKMWEKFTSTRKTLMSSLSPSYRISNWKPQLRAPEEKPLCLEQGKGKKKKKLFASWKTQCLCFQILKRDVISKRDNHKQHFLLRTKTKAKKYLWTFPRNRYGKSHWNFNSCGGLETSAHSRKWKGIWKMRDNPSLFSSHTSINCKESRYF